jgi:ABC-type nitrate/sulfonate/bicarbonate transport system substrate-binding protein
MQHSHGWGKRQLWLLKPVVIAAIAATALVSTTVGTADAARSHKSLVTVNVGVQAPVPIFAAWWFMQENPGICKPFGVKPNFEQVTPISGPPALLSGSVPIQVEANGSYFEEAAKGADQVVLLGGYGPLATYFWGAKNIKTPKDFAGTTVAATTPGGASDLLALLAIKLAGLKPSQVKIDFVGSGQAIIALTVAGTTSGFSDPAPLPAFVTAAGIHPVINLTTSTKSLPLNTLAVVADGPYYRSHASAVHGILQCVALADHDAVVHKQGVITSIEEVLGYSESLANKAWIYNHATWNIFPFTKSLALQAIAAVRAGGESAAVAGYKYNKVDVALNALVGIKYALQTPPGIVKAGSS